MAKKVLIVEGDGWWHDEWFRRLGSKVGLHGEIAFVSALSARDGGDQFEANPDVAAVVVGPCVSEDSPTTVPFVQKVRAANFEGPVIAVGPRGHRQKLVLAGCGHESTMADLPQTLVTVLG